MSFGASSPGQNRLSALVPPWFPPESVTPQSSPPEAETGLGVLAEARQPCGSPPALIEAEAPDKELSEQDRLAADLQKLCSDSGSIQSAWAEYSRYKKNIWCDFL